MLTTTLLLGMLLWAPPSDPPAGSPTTDATAPEAPKGPDAPASGAEPDTGPTPAGPPADGEAPATTAAAPVAATATSTVPAPTPVAEPAEPDGRRGKRGIGGFGAFDLHMSEIDAAFGLTLGGIGGVILKDRLLLGGGYYGMVFHDRNYVSLVDTQKLNLNYAGGYIGTYALRSPRVDGGAGVFLAGGRACLESAVDNNCADKVDIFAAHVEGTIYIKLAKIVRVGLLVGYDFFAGADNWRGPDDWDLSGFAGSVRLEIGHYDTTSSPGGKGRRGGRGRR